MREIVGKGEVRPHTIRERRRLYLLARLIIDRHYRRPLTLEVVAKALASSPRQLQRAYAQFSDSSFREDLVARRMAAAAELLSQPAIPVRDVAHLVGYRQPPHFAQAFRRRYGVSPARFREELRQAKRQGALRSEAQDKGANSHTVARKSKTVVR